MDDTPHEHLSMLCIGHAHGDCAGGCEFCTARCGCTCHGHVTRTEETAIMPALSIDVG